MGHVGLKLAITLVGLAVIITRVAWPELRLDGVTLGILAMMLLPWLSPLIRSAEFPGGWKVEFQEVKEAGDRVTKGTPKGLESGEAIPRPSYLDLSDRDPNLALVGLRIEIERRLRKLAELHSIRADQSLTRLLDELRRRQVLDLGSASGLRELLMAGNQAAHGALVEPRAAAWAVEYGPLVLSTLDFRIREAGGGDAV